MNHAVGRLDVRGDDVHAVDRHRAVSHVKGQFPALQRSRRQPIGHIRSHDLTAHHMEKQDIGQIAGRIGQQRIHRAWRQRRKGLIGRRKDRKRPFALERVHQPRRLHSSHQRAECLAGRRSVHDVHHFGRRLSSRFRGRFRRRRGQIGHTRGHAVILQHRARTRRAPAVDGNVSVAVGVKVHRRREGKAVHHCLGRGHALGELHNRTAVGGRPLVGENGILHTVEIAIRPTADVGQHGLAGGKVRARAARGHLDHFSRTGDKGRAAQQRHQRIAVIVKRNARGHGVGQHFAAAQRVREDARQRRKGRQQLNRAGADFHAQQRIAARIRHPQLAIGACSQAIGVRLDDRVVRVHAPFDAPGRHHFRDRAIRADLQNRRGQRYSRRFIRRAGSNPHTVGDIHLAIQQRQMATRRGFLADRHRGQQRHHALRAVRGQAHDLGRVAIGRGHRCATGRSRSNFVLAAHTRIHHPHAAVRGDQHALRRIQVGDDCRTGILRCHRRHREGQRHQHCHKHWENYTPTFGHASTPWVNCCVNKHVNKRVSESAWRNAISPRHKFVNPGRAEGRAPYCAAKNATKAVNCSAVKWAYTGI